MKRQFVALLVEDCDEDVFLFRRAVEKTGRAIALQHVRSAMEAQHYLLGESRFSNRAEYPLPTVVFTDLNLHGLDGQGFLEWMRGQTEFRMIPCIIYSGSINPADVLAA